MAASAMKGPQYLQIGPRQGVHCRPTVVLSSWPNGGYQVQHTGSHPQYMRWRASQFRSPDHNYRLRARTDPEKLPPDNIPQIAGQIIERPSSATSQEINSRPAHKIHVSRSSCNLRNYSSTSSNPTGQSHTHQQSVKPTRPSSGTHPEDRHKKSNTAPAFSIQACAVTIQARSIPRYVPAPKRIAPPKEPFPYPDPVQVGGDHAFNVRLAELAGLQRETIKYEECRARIARRNAAATTSSSTSTLQAYNRQPVRPSSGICRPSTLNKNGLNRRISLPAHAVQDKPSPQECSVNSRQLSGPFRKSSNASKLENISVSVENSSSEEKIATNSKERECSVPSSNNSKIEPECMMECVPVMNTCSKETCSKEMNIVEEAVDVQSSCDVPSVAPQVPSNKHRELVETIFSGEKNRKKARQHEKMPTVSCIELHLTADEVQGAGTNALEVISQKESDGEEKKGNETINFVAKSSSKAPTSVPTTIDHSYTKSRTPLQSSESPAEMAAASPQVTSPNESSPHSSTSSCSLTSGHSSPTRSTRHHTNKSRTKPSKTKKLHKKAGKHKKESHSG